METRTPPFRPSTTRQSGPVWPPKNRDGGLPSQLRVQKALRTPLAWLPPSPRLRTPGSSRSGVPITSIRWSYSVPNPSTAPDMQVSGSLPYASAHLPSLANSESLGHKTCVNLLFSGRTTVTHPAPQFANQECLPGHPCDEIFLCLHIIHTFARLSIPNFKFHSNCPKTCMPVCQRRC